MTACKDKTIRLDETTRMRVLDLGDKQIRIRVETPTPVPRGRVAKAARSDERRS